MVICAMPKGKSPSTNGLTMDIFGTYWSILGEDYIHFGGGGDSSYHYELK